LIENQMVVEIPICGRQGWFSESKRGLRVALRLTLVN